MESRMDGRTDGKTEGWTDERTDRTGKNYIPLRLTSCAGGIMNYNGDNTAPPDKSTPEETILRSR